MDHNLLVFVAGALAGAMNALAGGGSFVSLPALIAAGVPAVQANASSTVALFPGGVTSAWAYRDGLRPVGPASLGLMVAVTVTGGAIGAILLLHTPARTFNAVLPWLLLIATLALMFGGWLGRRLRERTHIGDVPVVFAQFLLGVYGGYFGGAVGIMMMAVWSLFDDRDLKSMSGARTVLVTSANAIAVITFIVARAVYWHDTLVMLFAAAIGGYGGAHIGRRVTPGVIRVLTFGLAIAITIAFFLREAMGVRT